MSDPNRTVTMLSGEPVPPQTSGKTVAATVVTAIMTLLTAALLRYTGLDLAADPEINTALETLVTGAVAAASAGIAAYYKRNYLK